MDQPVGTPSAVEKAPEKAFGFARQWVSPSMRRVQRSMRAPDFSNAGWMFEVVFDYGEGHYQEVPADANGRIFATASLKPPIGSKCTFRRPG
jgi:hypothetical protein